MRTKKRRSGGGTSTRRFRRRATKPSSGGGAVLAAPESGTSVDSALIDCAPLDGRDELARAVGEFQERRASLFRQYGLGDDFLEAQRALDDLLDGAIRRLVATQAAALRESEERLRLAIAASGLGTWEVEPHSGRRVLSQRARELFDIGPAETVTPERFAAALHPDDRPRWATAMQEALDPDKRAEYQMVYRTLRSDGTERYVISTGRAYFEGGVATRFLGTAQDITEQKRAERERELFLDMLGHDLRTPLTAVSLAAAQLVRCGDPQTRRAAERIESSASRMQRMIDELLDFARANGGTLVLNRRFVDIRSLCAEVLDELRVAYPDRLLTLACDGNAAGEWDGDRLAQVVGNLVANAFAHGYPESPVRVAIRAEPGAVLLEVANQGPPIPEATRDRLFDPFHRGTSQGSGLGLGLHIARSIALAHGGDISVTSDETETRFLVRLPLTQ